jgi:hypothetical protein
LIQNPAQRTPSGGIRLTEAGLQELAAEASALEVRCPTRSARLEPVSQIAYEYNLHLRWAQIFGALHDCAISFLDWRQGIICLRPFLQAWRSAASAVNDELSPVRATVLPAPQAGSLAAKTGSAAALLVSCSFGVQRLEAEVAALTRGDEAAIVEDQMQVSAPLQLLLLPTLHLSTLANRHSFIFCWLLIPARHALLVIFPGLAAGGAGQAGPTLGAPAAEPGLHSQGAVRRGQGGRVCRAVSRGLHTCIQNGRHLAQSGG